MNQSFLSRILKKNWSTEQIGKYIGHYIGSHFTYANDESLRREAASGGSVSGILDFLLNKNIIDGALVCRGKITQQGNYRSDFFIAKTKEELIQAQGSKYVAVNFSHDALPIIREFNGRLAIVALPCDITILQRLCNKDNEFRKKIIVKIALFCGHNSEPVLTDTIINRIRPGDRMLTKFRHRIGRWRGSLQADFNEGYRISRPFSIFSDYQNCYFFCQRKCHHCHDHTGYNADISAGDIWSLQMKKEAVKHNAIITRNEMSENILAGAIESGWIIGKSVPIEEVCDGQSRTMPFHYNISARSRAAWIIGEKIKDKMHEKVSISEYLAASMVLVNEKFSRGTFGKKVIFNLPKPLLKCYLYLLKALESIS